MKKNLIILTLALLIALPVFGLAADVTTPEAQTTQTAALGGQYGRRWNQAPQAPAAQQGSYVDADDDGKCDICGNEQGTNATAPGFVDADNDGTCDNYGTDLQGQGGNRQGNGGGQNAQGKGVQGSAQGQSFVDADGNGVCDNLGTDAGQTFGRGRNRK